MTAPAITAVTASTMTTIVPAAVATSANARSVIVDVTINHLATRARFVCPDADEYGKQHEYDEDAEDYHDDLLTLRHQAIAVVSLSSCIVLDR